jgi:diguanylate cyclase (GGDEF)-like protein
MLPPPDEFKGQALLIVDDSPTVRRGIRMALEPSALFAEYIEAKDGLEALRILNQRAIDVILCDVEMPGLDGFKFLDLMKGTPEYRGIPVILLTGLENVQKKIAGLERGASDYVTKPFDRGELIARVRVQLKLKILQDKLRVASITDYLTKQYNRRHFMEMLQTEFDRSIRYGNPLSFVILDIDHFKKINDSRGHMQGDRVLVDVSALVRSSVRSHDVVARYGGEEFVILLPQIDEMGATTVAEKVRRIVAETAFSGMEGQPVTISLGLVTFPGKDLSGTLTVDALIHAADDALYRAKEGGRNRLEIGTLNP